MGVEHILSRILVIELKYGSLALAHCHHICVLIRDHTRATSVKMVQVSMQMKVVYRIKFQHINKINSDKLSRLYLYRMMHIVVWDSVHRVEVIFSIKVCVKA